MKIICQHIANYNRVNLNMVQWQKKSLQKYFLKDLNLLGHSILRETYITRLLYEDNGINARQMYAKYDKIMYRFYRLLQPNF